MGNTQYLFSPLKLIYKTKHWTESWRLTLKPWAFNAISELMNSELQLIIMTLTNSDNEV